MNNPLGKCTPNELPKLPYADDALAPVVSANTISFHHGKHHNAYVTTLTKLTAGTDLEGACLEDIIVATAGKDDKKPIFNNAAQVWNHNFYWKSLCPPAKFEVPEKVSKLAETSYESLDALKEDWVANALKQFGSGWAWLVKDGDKLSIAKTGNAEVPWLGGVKPLAVVDVWEHAYYLDYQNKREEYVRTVLNKILNWNFVLENL